MIVVRLGVTKEDISMSSNPTIDRSSGRLNPNSLAPFLAPRAKKSLEQKTAVGEFLKERSKKTGCSIGSIIRNLLTNFIERGENFELL